MIAVREYTSAIEMMRAAQATRARLWGGKTKANGNAPAKQKPEPVVVKARQVPPMWTTQEMHFDLHVIQSEYILSALKAGIVERTWITKKTVNDIVYECLKQFPQYKFSDIIGRRRATELVLARQICQYEVRMQRPDLSFPEIARRFGGRDHTTILYAVRKITAMKESGELNWYFGEEAAR